MIATGATPDAIEPAQLRRIKPLRKLPLLASLHEVGCGRDRAGNRQLHFDEYVTLVLLYLFNPLIDSVRSLQQAPAVEQVAGRIQNNSASLRLAPFAFGAFLNVRTSCHAGRSSFWPFSSCSTVRICSLGCWVPAGLV